MKILKLKAVKGGHEWGLSTDAGRIIARGMTHSAAQMVLESVQTVRYAEVCREEGWPYGSSLEALQDVARRASDEMQNQEGA